MAKILVVEDVQSLRLLYKMDLEQAGHEVITARTAIEALALLEAESPQLVVLDVRMPGIDGLDTTMRMIGRGPKIPLVLISGDSSCASDWRCRAADAFIMKSSDTGELRAKIGELLKTPQNGVVKRFSK